MNPFFLSIPSKPQNPSITYQSNIIMVGSCFVENVQKKLSYYKLPNTCNSFGIIFHPEAIDTLIKRVASQLFFTEKDLFFHNEQWHCFEVHSKFSNPDKVQLLKNLNTILTETYLKLKTASHFIITYGTAWGYKKENAIVANCHKVPQKELTKSLSSVDAIEATFKNTFNTLKKINPSITIITTVSPVRHIKDGIIENNLSKAHLITALHKTIKNTPNTHYYPAYELVIDCLRDYRFYKDDLVHPNQTAVDYVWEHFTQTWIYGNDTTALMKSIREIQQGIAHKPFNPESKAHQNFINALKKKQEELIKKLPFLEF